jgi:DNA polymerase elongation subunit (family B)
MEYEKTYLPLVLQRKKNYVGVKYEMDDNRWKIDYKGIAVKRRNYCNFVKETFWGIIYPSMGLAMNDSTGKLEKMNWTLDERSHYASTTLEEKLKKLISHNIPMDDLAMSASLKSNYKGDTCTECNGKKTKELCKTCAGRGIIVNLPQVQLANRMTIRDPGSAPKSGQRFKFIYVNDPTRDDKLSSRSEDILFAKQNNLKPDYLYYLNQQVKKPIEKYMELIGLHDTCTLLFNTVEKTVYEQLKKERQHLSNIAKNEFFTGKRPTQVTALKPLKKVKKDPVDKKAQKITSFFTSNK